MNNNEIKDKLFDITKLFLKISDNEISKLDDTDILYGILSNSEKAVHYVSIIEDEFEIEFDDDDIDIDFFSSIENIVLVIKKYV